MRQILSLILSLNTIQNYNNYDVLFFFIKCLTMENWHYINVEMNVRHKFIIKLYNNAN